MFGILILTTSMIGFAVTMNVTLHSQASSLTHTQTVVGVVQRSSLYSTHIVTVSYGSDHRL